MTLRHQVNRLRAKAIFVSRAYKDVFRTPEGPLRNAAEKVLADLRDWCFAQKSTFDPDPYIAARRQGRRDVWLRIAGFLNLDEAQVQTLMEIDDGE